jgi:hypothetical protein
MILPNLEEYLRTHAEKAVDNPEGKNHGHAIDKSTKNINKRKC